MYCICYLMTSQSNSVYQFCEKLSLLLLGLTLWPAFRVCWWHILGMTSRPCLFSCVCTAFSLADWPCLFSRVVSFISDSVCPTPMKSFIAAVCSLLLQIALSSKITKFLFHGVFPQIPYLSDDLILFTLIILISLLYFFSFQFKSIINCLIRAHVYVKDTKDLQCILIHRSLVHISSSV